jgi:hypothetical protein
MISDVPIYVLQGNAKERKANEKQMASIKTRNGTVQAKLFG